MKTILFILVLATSALAAEAPQETTRELELRRALIDSQMTVMRLNFNQLNEELKKLDVEIEKRKPKETQPTK